MPNNWQQDVATFMTEIKGLELPERPSIPNDDIRSLCMALIDEESDELYHAGLAQDLVEVADAIADLLYVTLYTANAYGLDMAPIFAEVQRSNMTKKGGAKREDGKQLKGPGYEPPNLKTIVESQL